MTIELIRSFEAAVTADYDAETAAFRRGSPIERSGNYGIRSSNTGTNPPNEAED